jgi:hypothetical protein
MNRLARHATRLGLLGLLMSPPSLQASAGMLPIDDFARSSGPASQALSNFGTSWRVVTDTVMGGASSAGMDFTTLAERRCLRLAGTVSLENNGGFVQASLDLAADGGSFDASQYAGIELDVYGNGESYNLHLRTADTWIVWQSYRASFQAPPGWRTLRLPFGGFEAYRTRAPLDLRQLKRIGLVAIGREMQADLCLGRIAFYR